MRLATGGDVVLAGFRLTREEWDDLDEVSRALLLGAEEDLRWTQSAANDEDAPYLSLEIIPIEVEVESD